VAALATCCFLALPARASAQSGENVAVVINDNSPDSQRIGEYYARVRKLPPTNVLHIRTLNQETVDRVIYEGTIEGPIGAAIARERLQDRILYLVLTKGVPLRVLGSVGPKGTMASVDSELTVLYRRMLGEQIHFEGGVPNPYFLGDRDISEAKPFTHRDNDVLLVTRLDAYTVDEAIGLIDKGLMPSRSGRIVLDQRAALTNRTGEDWLELASKRLSAEGHGESVLLEATPKPARDVKDVLGYSSWGSTDPQNRVRSYGMTFVPGAIAANLVGTDGRTFRAPPESWVPTGDSANRASWYGGSPESLIGDLIREGVTGVSGYVAQPLLNGVVRPQILYPAYVSGFNLAESFYLATPYLGWQGIVIGDPLCAPFSKKPLSRADIEDGIDSATEMPALFSKRRLAIAMAQAPGISEAAVAMTLRAQVASQRGDPKAARERLKEAVQMAPRYADAWLQGALLDERAGESEEAIAGYQKVLEIQPNHVIALKNLEFGVASARKMPAEALPSARKAAALAPTNLPVLDTLAWIQHLVGDDESAAKVMTQVARANLPIATVRLHAAIIFAAQGAKPAAQNELAAAVKLNPALEQSEDVKQLRVKLGVPAPAARPSRTAPGNSAPPRPSDAPRK
jgi:uncharacterized protein (TIGR03790 family)